MTEPIDTDRARAAVVDAAEGKRKGRRLLTVRDLLVGSMERATREEKRDYCTTGVYEIDDASGGIRPGFVWLVGGDTSVGKSSLLVQVADVNLERDRNVLIVSSEDPESLYGDRLMQRRARVNAKNLRDGKLSLDEADRVRMVVERAERKPVYLDARGRKAEWVAEQVENIIDEHDIDLVAYDYIQEFRSGKHYNNRTQELEEVGSVLRHAVKGRGKAGIIFSQITVTEAKSRPDKHSIRNCRDISNAAEAIFLLWEPKDNVVKDGKIKILGGTKCVFVDKIKNGPRNFIVPLSWDAECACFNCSHRGKSPEEEAAEESAA